MQLMEMIKDNVLLAKAGRMKGEIQVHDLCAAWMEEVRAGPRIGGNANDSCINHCKREATFSEKVRTDAAETDKSKESDGTLMRDWVGGDAVGVTERV